jgi:hypothetical protein
MKWSVMEELVVFVTAPSLPRLQRVQVLVEFAGLFAELVVQEE